MEALKTPNSQSNLEKKKKKKEKKMELDESSFLTSGCTTKLQSSKQCDIGMKTEIKTNETSQKAQK